MAGTDDLLQDAFDTLEAMCPNDDRRGPKLATEKPQLGTICQALAPVGGLSCVSGAQRPYSVSRLAKASAAGWVVRRCRAVSQGGCPLLLPVVSHRSIAATD
jgi:hypothetical protein